VTPIVKEYGGMIALGVGVAAVAAIGLYFVGRKLASGAKDAAAAVGTAVNPLDPDNLASRATGALVEHVTGGAENGGESSVGGLFARAREWISGDDAKIKAMLAGGTPPGVN